MSTTKKDQVILASVGRRNRFRSKKKPQKTLALLAARPEVSEARVLARTEKLLGGGGGSDQSLGLIWTMLTEKFYLLFGEVNADVYGVPLKSDQDRNQQQDFLPPQQRPDLA